MGNGFDPDTGLFARWRGRLSHIFRERELLIRSEGRVRYIRFRPLAQMSLAAAIIAGAGALGGVTAVSIYQSHEIASKRAEIVEARAAFSGLRNDILSLQKRVLSDEPVTGAPDDGFRTAAGVEDLSGISVALKGALDRLGSDINIAPDQRDRIIRARTELHDQILNLKTSVASAREREDELRRKLAEIERNMDEARKARLDAESVAQSLESDKRILEAEVSASRVREKRSSETIADLTGDISSYRERESALREEKSGLETQLGKVSAELVANRNQLGTVVDQMKDLVEKTASVVTVAAPPHVAQGDVLKALEVNVASLVTDLTVQRDRNSDINDTLSQVLKGLSRVAGKENGSDVPDDPVDRTRRLLSEIESLHETQLTVVNRLIEQTDRSIENAETIIDRTGLTRKMLADIGGRDIARGGPEIAVSFEGGSSEELANSLATLQDKTVQWRAMQDLLRCVPVVSPVDYYQLTSPFGKRRDPMSGRMAIHEGIDMGGWPGTPVYSSAPGKVVFAGRNGSYGKMVEIDHGCGIHTRYGHLKKVLVKKGQEVGHRTEIGQLGNTGRSTGPHVHYEIRVRGEPLDPEKFIEAGRYVFKD